MNYIARAATQLSRKMDNECFLLRVAAMVWLDPIIIMDMTLNEGEDNALPVQGADTSGHP